MSANTKTIDWGINANIYEVNIRQYTPEGSFNAFAKHLPRLKEMGVDILWLMPITPISVEKRQGSLGSYYACRSYTKINPEFGDLDDFKALVNEAHALGFKLIIDWVANHTGCDHEWTTEYPHFYRMDAQGTFTERNGWKDVIDLNYDNYDMRNAMIQSMKYWVETCDIDGFRCDMAHLVTLDFWQQARQACDALKPLFWLAECDQVEYHAVFDVSYAWEWMHVSEKIPKYQASLFQMKDVLNKYFTYPAGSQKMYYTSNHDENSWNGTEYEKYGDAAKTFAVFASLWRGCFLIYSGQELPNYKRLKFFDKDEIDWNGKTPELQDFYKKLLDVKKTTNALKPGNEINELLTVAEDKVMVCLFVNGDDKLLMILNFSSLSNMQFGIEHEKLPGNYKNIFSGEMKTFEKVSTVNLQQYEYWVYVSV